MGAEIDRLEVAVEAQASKANQQLDLLINKLLKVSNTLTGVNINGFSGMAAGVRNLSAAMKTMSGVKAADFTKTAKGIERLGGVNTSNFQNTAQNVRALVDACIALSGVKAPQIDTNSITALAKSMGALSKIDGENFAPVANGIRQIADSVTALGGANTKDTGINNTINALKRLMETKLDGFDPAIFGQITQSIAALGGVPDVSRNLNQFIGSLARLAAAGPATQQTANALPVLAANLRAAIQSVSGVGNISDSVNMFVQSVGRLASAGNKTGQTAAQLDVLAQETLKFFQAMTQAPHISRNTIAMTQALAQLASAGGKVGTATGTVTNAFRRLSSIGKSTLSSVKKVANGIVSSFKKIGNSSGHINTATFSLRNLFRAVLPLLGIRQLFNWGKQAVEVASDLTEVQNVVDVTFGDMRDKANEFASTALRSLGMSELSAKQISSRFQAMGTAMGIESSAVSRASEFLEEHSRLYGKTASSMADMSIEVTKLAADMASFYNVEQADVAKDLEAIFTGQTKPMRAYGVDLTQATLQEWALKQGIDANVQSMSQAAKTLLRYQYVMANTGAAQGDFARTAGTWANQTRILAQSFQVLGSTVGNVLINVFKPLVSWLNTVMLKVISVVETIANALGAIFGWTMEITPGGATSDYDDMADGIGGVGDAADAAGGSLGKATEKAKEFQRFLAGFDEIEKIPDESDAAVGSGGSGSGGSGSGGGAGGADAGTAQLVKTESLFEKYKSDIKTLEQLGEYIGQSLTKAMQSINWNAIYEKARGFGTGLASFLNGLISPELFSETGRLVANSLNTALYALNSFGTTFKWDNFGNSIAAGINSFFKNFKFNLAADTFDTFVNGIVDSMAATFGDGGINWSQIGAKTKDFIVQALNGIEWENANTAFSSLGSGLATALNGIITTDTFSSVGQTFASVVNTVVSGAHSFIGEIKWKEWGRAIAKSIDDFFADTNWKSLGLTFGDAVNGILTTLSRAVKGIGWEQIGRDIADMIKAIPWREVLKSAADLIGSVFAGLLDFSSALLQELDPNQWTDFNRNIDTTLHSLRYTNDELEKRIENASNWKNAGAEYDYAEDLADKYFDLAEKEGKTNKETEEMKDLAAKLVQTVPQLEQYYNKETGLLDTTRTSVSNLIEALKAKARTEAAQDALKEYYSTQLDAKKAMDEAGKAAKELNEHYDEQKQKYDDLTVKITDATKKYGVESGEVYNLVGQQASYYEEMLKTEKKLDDVNGTLEDAKENYNAAGKEIDTITGYLVDMNEETGNAAAGIDDLSTVLSNLPDDVKVQVQTILQDDSLSLKEKKIKVAALVTGLEDGAPLSEKYIDDVWAKVTGIDDEISGKNKFLPDFKVGASVEVKSMELSKKVKKLSGITAVAETVLPGANAILAGMSAVVDSVSKATGINSLKDLGASIMEVWKSGNPILKNVQATVSKTDRQVGSTLTVTDVGAKVSNTEKQSGSTLTVMDVGAKVSNTEKQAGSTLTVSDVNAKANTIDWGAQVQETAKILNMHAKANTIDWSAQAQETMKTLGVFAKSNKVAVVDNAVAVQAGSNKVMVTNNGVTVDATSKKVGVDDNNVSVAAKAGSISWKSGLSDTAKTLSGIAAKASGVGWQSKATKTLNGVAAKTGGIDWQSKASKTLSGIAGVVSSITKGSNVTLALTAVFSVLTTGLKLLFKEGGGMYVGGTWRPVTAYAGGGAPDMGQMFIAREAGPELVGTIGGHTAVMNNDQIVSSVSDGVYRAVSAAMVQSGGQSGAAPTFNIYIGGRQVTDFVIEDINGRTMATGTCPVLT